MKYERPIGFIDRRLQVAQFMCRQEERVWTGISDAEREVYLDAADTAVRAVESKSSEARAGAEPAVAVAARSDGCSAWLEAVAAEREACAKLLELSTGELLLGAGEMTAEELRTVKAVLAWRARVIRGRA